MRPIKFRGRVPEGYHPYGGQTVYGSLVRYREDAYWAQGYPNWIVLLDGHRSYPVNEDSVAQLVGFDADGNEVYEGDELVGANGFEFKARFVGNLTDGDKLKEEPKP